LNYDDFLKINLLVALAITPDNYPARGIFFKQGILFTLYGNECVSTMQRATTNVSIWPLTLFAKARYRVPLQWRPMPGPMPAIFTKSRRGSLQSGQSSPGLSTCSTDTVPLTSAGHRVHLARHTICRLRTARTICRSRQPDATRAAFSPARRFRKVRSRPSASGLRRAHGSTSS
jgi:hypothetical protein